MNNILITGGAGFIGSHVVRHFVKTYDNYHIYNLDALTYAGNLENLKDVESFPNYTFVKGDIRDMAFLKELFYKYSFDAVIHLAAESHVDRSIEDPLAFVTTNVIGTVNLLQVCKQFWGSDFKDKLFYHVSTDEVYGSLPEEGLFMETTSYDPNSPYSASKASSDHFVRAYAHTYGLPVVISNCSNNYGPFQFPEKLIPLTIHNILKQKTIPIYGNGKNIRDWLYVQDHALAIDCVFHQGKLGQTYNVGGLNQWANIDLVKQIILEMDQRLGNKEGHSLSLLKFVSDRPGHDMRYAIDASKLQSELKWSPSVSFEQGLSKTIEWYLNNQDWLEGVNSLEYQNYYQRQYNKRY
ncbi:dTDP-glucose 4,6-dehydratase [Myroides sp. LJL115]